MANVENKEVTASETENSTPVANKPEGRQGGQGQRRPRRDNKRDSAPKVDDGFDKKMVNINRITKTVKGGRKMRFNALVVVGDHNGKIGVGMGKAAEVPVAIEKATVDAKRHISDIALFETTIPHEIVGTFETTKVIMKPAKAGNGIIAGGSVRSVVEIVGIKDITTKLYGSNNPVNCVKATIDGLKKLRNAETIASLRGKAVEEI